MDQYKLAIIESNGLTEKIGNRQEEELHIICLLDYIKRKYPNNMSLQKLNIRHTPNTVGFFFTLYGNVVVFNTTKNVQKHGKSAFLMMPTPLSEEQQKSLEQLLETMPDYFVTIAYDMKVVEGVLESKELSSTERLSPIEVLKKYYDKVGIRNRKEMLP